MFGLYLRICCCEDEMAVAEVGTTRRVLLLNFIFHFLLPSVVTSGFSLFRDVQEKQHNTFVFIYKCLQISFGVVFSVSEALFGLGSSQS
jgi:hypothetical protein